MKIKNPSLEFLIKTIVSLLAIIITLGITSTALYVEYKDRLNAEMKQLKEVSSLVRYLSTSEATLLVNKVGKNWVFTNTQNPDGEFLTLRTADGFQWNVTLDRKKIFSEMLLNRRLVIVMGMIGLLLALEIAILLAYSLTRPLKAIAWTCQQVSSGKWTHIPGNPSKFKEIQILKETFNSMVDQLKKLHERERQVARAERLAALGQLVAGVSHEIRNPLAAMRVHLDLLSETVSEEGKPSLMVLDQEIDRLNSTVSQLLNFARPKALVKGPVSLRELFGWTFNMVKMQLSKKNIQWRHELPQKDIYVWGDRDKLQQMLLNLVLNAIKAMEETGGTLEIKAIEETDFALLSIKDHGPGIPEELIERIFDPFFTTRPDGTGLGLPLVLQIVQMHEGSIEVDPGPGAEFKIQLPLYREGGRN
jgi:signal transduction histidine kinase